MPQGFEKYSINQWVICFSLEWPRWASLPTSTGTTVCPCLHGWCPPSLRRWTFIPGIPGGPISPRRPTPGVPGSPLAPLSPEGKNIHLEWWRLMMRAQLESQPTGSLVTLVQSIITETVHSYQPAHNTLYVKYPPHTTLVHTHTLSHIFSDAEYMHENNKRNSCFLSNTFSNTHLYTYSFTQAPIDPVSHIFTHSHT